MHNQPQYDIVIIGAGPAGSNLARLIDSVRYRVLLLDASTMRVKVCAGLLSPDAQRLFDRYGIVLPQGIFVDPQLCSVRVIDLAEPCVRHYRRSYLNVDRTAFDSYLRGLVPSSVDVMQARCHRIERIHNGYRLHVHHANGEQIQIDTHHIVGADGASSLVRSTLFASQNIQKYVAIQQWFSAEAIDPYYSCVFDRATSESCSWIFFKQGQLVFGGAFSPKGCRVAFEAQKRKLIEQGIVPAHIFDHPLKTEACRVSRPHLHNGIYHGDRSAYLIGEAAGFISPSSFEGISYALASSEALAAAFNSVKDDSDILRIYRKKSSRLCHKIRLKCFKRPFMYVPCLRKWILKTGLGSSKRI